MIEQNGFQILVWREILHKISHFVANFRFGPPPSSSGKLVGRQCI